RSSAACGNQPGRSARSAPEEAVEGFDRLRQVGSAQADADVGIAEAEGRRREEQDAGGLDEAGGEAVGGRAGRATWDESRERRRAAARAHPAERVGAAGEEVVEDPQVGAHDLA